jgi:hypothetical protein
LRSRGGAIFTLLVVHPTVNIGSDSYFAFLAFSDLNFAQRFFVAFEILARAAADIVLFRVAPLGVTMVARE